MTNQNLPPFLMTSEMGSFARFTIEKRKPKIIDQILVDNDYPQEIIEALRAFQIELVDGTMQLLHEKTSDQEMWNRILKKWQEKTWLELPWFLAEAYFYRRILALTRYFQPGPWFGRNPYQFLKQQTIKEAAEFFLHDYPQMPEGPSFQKFHLYLLKSLWGNRGDLSNLSHFDRNMDAQTENVLLDNSLMAFNYLERPGKIGIFFDNVGKELFFDLALADYLLVNQLACSITFYLKNQPFFVSDAEIGDLDQTLNLMLTSADKQNHALGNRLDHAIRKGQIEINTPPFFTQPFMYRQMPPALKNKIEQHDLVILKGDVNYRRLIGDRHWPLTTSVQKAAGYFPTSFLSLRTLKGELAVGLSEEIIQKMEDSGENDWLINGKRGLITFWQKPPDHK